MISYVKQYNTEIVAPICEELKSPDDANYLLQFNAYNDLIISYIFDYNISVPLVPLDMERRFLTPKYQHIDKIFVFNNYEYEVYQDYKREILNIPIQINHNKLYNKLTQHKLYNFGYLGSLEIDKPIILDILTAFLSVANRNRDISLSMLLETDANSAKIFKQQIYQEYNVSDHIAHRLHFISQRDICKETKEMFINSINSLLYFDMQYTDNYLLQYALCSNIDVYTTYNYFTDIFLLDSHLNNVIMNQQHILYNSPDIDSMMSVFNTPNQRHNNKNNNSQFLNFGINNLL